MSDVNTFNAGWRVWCPKGHAVLCDVHMQCNHAKSKFPPDPKCKACKAVYSDEYGKDSIRCPTHGVTNANVRQRSEAGTLVSGCIFCYRASFCLCGGWERCDEHLACRCSCKALTRGCVRCDTVAKFGPRGRPYELQSGEFELMDDAAEDAAMHVTDVEEAQELDFQQLMFDEQQSFEGLVLHGAFLEATVLDALKKEDTANAPLRVVHEFERRPAKPMSLDKWLLLKTWSATKVIATWTVKALTWAYSNSDVARPVIQWTCASLGVVLALVVTSGNCKYLKYWYFGVQAIFLALGYGLVWMTNVVDAAITVGQAVVEVAPSWDPRVNAVGHAVEVAKPTVLVEGPKPSEDKLEVREASVGNEPPEVIAGDALVIVSANQDAPIEAAEVSNKTDDTWVVFIEVAEEVSASGDVVGDSNGMDIAYGPLAPLWGELPVATWSGDYAVAPLTPRPTPTCRVAVGRPKIVVVDDVKPTDPVEDSLDFDVELLQWYGEWSLTMLSYIFRALLVVFMWGTRQRLSDLNDVYEYFSNGTHDDAVTDETLLMYMDRGVLEGPHMYALSKGKAKHQVDHKTYKHMMGRDARKEANARKNVMKMLNQSDYLKILEPANGGRLADQIDFELGSGDSSGAATNYIRDVVSATLSAANNMYQDMLIEANSTAEADVRDVGVTKGHLEDRALQNAEKIVNEAAKRMRRNGEHRAASALLQEVQNWKAGTEEYEDVPAPNAVHRKKQKKVVAPVPKAQAASSSNQPIAAVVNPTETLCGFNWADDEDWTPTLEAGRVLFNNGKGFSNQMQDPVVDRAEDIQKALARIKQMSEGQPKMMVGCLEGGVTRCDVSTQCEVGTNCRDAAMQCVTAHTVDSATQGEGRQSVSRGVQSSTKIMADAMVQHGEEDKTQAKKKGKERRLESTLSGSNLFDPLQYVSHCHITSDGRCMTFMGGHVRLNDAFYVMSARHIKVDGVDKDLYSMLGPVTTLKRVVVVDGKSLVLDCEVQKGAIVFDTNAENVIGPADAMYWPVSTTLRCAPRGKARVGDTITYVTPQRAPKRDFGSPLMPRSATIRHISNNGIVYMNGTTQMGDCRTPYFNQRGEIVAYHRYGSIYFGSEECNGGDRAWAPTPGKKGFVPVMKSELILPPTADGVDLQSGVLKQVGVLPVYGAPRTRVYPFRDRVRFGYVPLTHGVLKPGTDLLHDEINKFADEATIEMPQKFVDQAGDYVRSYDASRCRTRFPGLDSLTLEDVRDSIRKLDMTSSAGYGITGSTSDHIKRLGDGDFEAGLLIAAAQVLEEAKRVESGEGSFVVWKVFGKEDKYPYKKLQPALEGKSAVVRSIQSPPFMFKCLHLLYFGDSDARWNLLPEYAIGENQDAPLTRKVQERLERARVADGTDATGWDRYVPRALMEWYFMKYLPTVVDGVPTPVLEYFAMNTIDSRMLMGDGVVYVKHQGNPSGYPNTLRLNSVINKVVTMSCELAYAEEVGKPLDVVDIHKHAVHYFCGDDMVRFLDEELAYLSCDGYFAACSRYYPKWKLKMEGRADRADYADAHAWWLACPTFISRSWIPANGRIWRAHGDFLRVMAKYMFVDPDEDEVLAAAKLVGVHDALLHSIEWLAAGTLCAPILKKFLKDTGVDVAKYRQRYMNLWTAADQRDEIDSGVELVYRQLMLEPTC